MKSTKANLKRGTRIEMEHTKGNKLKKLKTSKTSQEAAKKIAKDHQKEHPKYYDKKKGLPAMEKRLTKSEKKRGK